MPNEYVGQAMNGARIVLVPAGCMSIGRPVILGNNLYVMAATGRRSFASAAPVNASRVRQQRAPHAVVEGQW